MQKFDLVCCAVIRAFYCARYIGGAISSPSRRGKDPKGIRFMRDMGSIFNWAVRLCSARSIAIAFGRRVYGKPPAPPSCARRPIAATPPAPCQFSGIRNTVRNISHYVN